MNNLREIFVIVLLSMVNITKGIENSSVDLPFFCCPLGEAQWAGICVEDNVTVSEIKISMYDEDNVEVYELGKDSQLVINDLCDFNWMKRSILKDFYIVVSNGTISYVSDSDNASRFDVEHFCLFRELKSTVYIAKVCRPWIKIVYWQLSCLIFATVVMSLILIVYSIIPELGNLHGLVFRAYLVTYISAHLCAVGHQLSSGSRDYNHLFTFFAFSMRYCGCCCALWLSVMSFNIWRSFRILRSIESHSRKQDIKKLIWYAIYVFGTPTILIIIAATLMYSVPHFRSYSMSNLQLDNNLILWTCSGLLITTVICNMFFHISTALTVRQYGKDTAAELRCSVNHHLDVHKQWFNLNFKLFVITGFHTLMWVIWELWPNPVFTSLLFVSEGLMSVLLFIIFVWKGTNITRLLRKRFGNMLINLQDRRESTSGSGT